MQGCSVSSPDPSSFRDPSGVVFLHEGKIYRQINCCYIEQYKALMNSGLYKKLTENNLLISHQEAASPRLTDEAALIIKPQKVSLISYPYEWCFGQIKDAALTTLRVHREALHFGMILKDASAYNIQFTKGKAVLIDTLSFDFYQEGKPWIAYGQFCRHFLAPLFLMAYSDIRLNQLMRIYIDGVPLDLASTLLKGKGGFSVLQHIHWHAKSIAKHGQDKHLGRNDVPNAGIKISKFQLTSMIDSMIKIVERLELKNKQTEWGDYYSSTNYSDEAFQNKKALVTTYLERISPSIIWDFGANDGTFSRLALREGAFVAAFDADPIAVEHNHLKVRDTGKNMLPLLLDLTNPSPSIGFANTERSSLPTRQKPDCIMMLAIIHHLAISNNLPLIKIAEWLASICEHLIIEFVPKQDSQVKVLLAARDDVFPNYTVEGFEDAMCVYFEILDRQPVKGSERFLYLMQSKEV